LSEERLQKVMARAGVASRRRCEALIRAGRVKVNGTTVTRLGTKVSPWDKIQVDGQDLVWREPKVYLLLNKPRGYLSTVHDPHGRATVIDLVKDVGVRVYPVGRLDLETEGLLLLTNDGELTHRLTHPRYKVPKTYLAVVQGAVPPEAINRLRRGVALEDGRTAPAQVKLLGSSRDTSTLEITIREGKKRQVRRMCQAVGHLVISLRRTRVGFLTLKGLKKGRYRHLAPGEIRRLKQLAGSGTLQEED